MEVFATFADWISTTLFELFLPDISQSKQTFLIMTYTLIATMSGVARDARIHIISVTLGVAAIGLVTIPLDQIGQADSVGRSGLANYAELLAGGIALLLVAVLIHFRRKPVDFEPSATYRKLGKGISRLILLAVAVSSIVAFYIVYTNLINAPQSTENPIIGGLAAAGGVLLFCWLLWLTISIAASGLIFVQLVIWAGSFSDGELIRPTLWDIVRLPFQQVSSDPTFARGGIAIGLMLGVTWLIYTIVSSMRAVDTMKLIRRYVIAIVGAFVVAVVSTEPSNLVTALFGLVAFIPVSS